MKHLIIYAHPYSKSFNHAILETTVASLEQLGHEVTVRDLYQLNFQPVLTAEDIVNSRSNNISKDIQIEQEFVRNTDYITFIYPIWWTGLPAIMKGYIDRIFSVGFAYRHVLSGIEKLLKGKKGFIINTHGTPKDQYDKSEMTKSLKMTSDAGIFEFTGIEPVGHLLFGNIASLEDQEYLAILNEIKSTIHRLFAKSL